jgi:hypothetical protein
MMPSLLIPLDAPSTYHKLESDWTPDDRTESSANSASLTPDTLAGVDPGPISACGLHASSNVGRIVGVAGEGALLHVRHGEGQMGGGRQQSR